MISKEFFALYVLITAARDEETNIQKTIESVVAQTIKPKKWIIVSDESTDRTEEIVNNEQIPIERYFRRGRYKCA